MVVKIMSNSKRMKEKVHFYVSILAGAVHISPFIAACVEEEHPLKQGLKLNCYRPGIAPRLG